MLTKCVNCKQMQINVSNVDLEMKSLGHFGAKMSIMRTDVHVV